MLEKEEEKGDGKDVEGENESKKHREELEISGEHRSLQIKKNTGGR